MMSAAPHQPAKGDQPYTEKLFYTRTQIGIFDIQCPLLCLGLGTAVYRLISPRFLHTLVGAICTREFVKALKSWRIYNNNLSTLW